MRRLISTLAFAAACAAGLAATSASAAVLSGPLGARAATGDQQLTDKVHCVPGWWHHRFRPHNGCGYRRSYYGGYGGYSGYGGYPGYYGYGRGPYIGGPGLSIRLGIGPRRRRGGW